MLPAALERVRHKLAGSDDGDRQMVAILATVLSDGLPAVEAACAQAQSEGVHSSDVILNILARRLVGVADPTTLNTSHDNSPKYTSPRSIRWNDATK